jgi:hypothetical protein
METTTLQKFARKSSVTGKGMNSGFLFESHDFYCEDETEAKEKAIELGYNSLEEAYQDEAYYWTDWEEIDEEDYYTADGKHFIEGVEHIGCHKCHQETEVNENFYFCQHCLTHL